MLLIVIALVLAIGIFILLGFREEGRDLKWKLRLRQFLAIAPLFLILFNFLAVIPANTVGIVYSPFFGVSEDVLSEGWQTKGIFDKIYKISTEIQSQTLESVTGQTKDSQYVEMNIDVKYKVNVANAFEIFRQYRTLDNVANSLIAPTVQRAIETVSTQYNVIDILGEDRNVLYAGIEEELAMRLSTNGITFVSINFNDTDAGEAIEQAIQKEAVAKKQAETAQQELLKIEIESQQTVVRAAADAQRIVVQAEANKEVAIINAEITEIEAAAEAAKYRIISDSITDELLKKWEMDARIAHGWITVQGGTIIANTSD